MRDTEDQLNITIQKELKKANGDVFFEAKRMPDNSFIAVNWIGIQSLETIVMGGNHILAMLREKACQGLLNSTKELIGPWDIAVNWLALKWAPQAIVAGLKYFAHVNSPGIYGQRSFDDFYHTLQRGLEIHAFTNDESAQQWLLLKSK